MKSKILLLAVAFAFLLSSCNKNQDLEVDYGHDYFPLEVGKFITYELDSTLYYRDIQSNEIRTRVRSLLVKEEIVNILTGDDESTKYVVERYERENPHTPWRIKSVWTAERNLSQALRTEENNRFIKLIFPVSPTTTPWDGNAFIDKNTSITVEGQLVKPFKNWFYEMTDVHNYKEIGDLSFDSTLTVIQANTTDFIEHRYSKEVYAKGVGLVAKEMQIFDSQCEFIECDENTPWEEKAERGFMLEMKVTGFN